VSVTSTELYACGLGLVFEVADEAHVRRAQLILERVLLHLGVAVAGGERLHLVEAADLVLRAAANRVGLVAEGEDHHEDREDGERERGPAHHALLA
jgi:hypothetical protein